MKLHAKTITTSNPVTIYQCPMSITQLQIQDFKRISLQIACGNPQFKPWKLAASAAAVWKLELQSSTSYTWWARFIKIRSQIHLKKIPLVPCMLKRFPWRGMQVWSDITLLLLQLKRESQKPYLIMRGRCWQIVDQTCIPTKQFSICKRAVARCGEEGEGGRRGANGETATRRRRIKNCRYCRCSTSIICTWGEQGGASNETM